MDHPDLYLRADASSQMGMGHLMRCLALASAWNRSGGRACFITFAPGRLAEEKIRAQDIESIGVERPWPHPSDLSRTLKILDAGRHEKKLPWLVLDGYHFSTAYQKAIKDRGIPLVVMDDYNHLDHYHADIIVNPSPGAKGLPYRLSGRCKLLAGTDHVLLREEFLWAPAVKKGHPEKARRLLITLGGSDPMKITPLLIDAVAALADPGLETRVILGPGFSDTSMPEAPGIELVRNPEMATMMAWADLAVTAGGSTCWELCRMGLPFMVIPVADNQEAIASGLVKKIGAVHAGPVETLNAEKLADILKRLIHDRPSREKMGRLGRRLIDGRGAERIIRQMKEINEN
ncbi:MAG: UDP-2,4-diacetamido-2,4,6-trideoxy-beta-L-altropyranose hydrolase [Desulfobacter sp.]|nr:MAG: UDP-2,4-diacetamido-2,4,6-trideoxy-beta-L-altropyranose hydrolase [Desulfobacter sp.]